MRKPGNGKDRPPPGGRALERLRDFARARGLGARPAEEPEDPAQAEHADEPAAPGQAAAAEEAAEPSHPQEEERS
jgi:hypothetical protein